MENRKALCLDLGTRTGYAYELCGVLHAGSESFAIKKADSPGVRFLRFVKWLRTTQEATLFNLVLYEKVQRHMGTEAAHVYGAFEGHLQAFCAEHSIEHLGISVGEIKKFATGKGNSNKEAMIAWANQRFPSLLIADDNVADALAIFHYHQGNPL